MKTEKVKRFLFYLIFTLVIVFLIASILPYFFTLSDERQLKKVSPFENGAFMDIDGVRLHYQFERMESDDGPEAIGNVLLIHGLGGSTFSWRYTLPDLSAQGFQVVAVDLPGFGYSDRKVGLDHSQKERSRLLWLLLDALETEYPELIDKQWNLVGHSMGGGTVVAMSLEQSQRTQKAVLVAGAVFQDNPRSGVNLLRYPPLARGISLVLERFFLTESRMEPVLASAYGRPVSQAELDGYVEPLKNPGTARFFIDLLQTAGNDPIEAVAETDIQLSGIWGGNDTWVPLSQGERIAEVVPDFRLDIIPEAAHCPMETHPEEFSELLIEMISHYY